jgi:hypothetical protein
MRRKSLLTVLGMLVIAATTFAAPAPAPAWATGKISSFDATAKTIVVKQGTHDMTFVLAPTAQLLQGKKTLQAADLSGDVGRSVKIRYTMAGGKRTADRIEVSEPAPTPATPPKKIK